MQAIEQILKNSEKNLGEICTILASYTRKTAKLRDKADLLVAALFDFSHTEDPEFQIGLKNLAEDLAMVQDYRHAQVERLETTVVTPLKAYGYIVKNKRVSLIIPPLTDITTKDTLTLRSCFHPGISLDILTQ
ncbi:hypothetical protein XENORESO_020031 [Xenotaenia resolanae]|uniref:Uncharacterized protein n=1 Tax=Xenotaenia resolanae TaxID=208358 RepID=A0ABV0W6E2_9TELE